MIGYDTIYAHQDREDDALIGVKSTARLFGDAHAARADRLLCARGAADRARGRGRGRRRRCSSVGCILFGAHLGWQIERLDIDDPDLCLRLFKSNRDAGLILFAALMRGRAVPVVFRVSV